MQRVSLDLIKKIPTGFRTCLPVLKQKGLPIMARTSADTSGPKPGMGSIY